VVTSDVIMRERGWRSAVVVNDGYHLMRASLIFERAGVTTYPSPVQATARPMQAVERIAREGREAAGVLWFGLRVLVGVDQTLAADGSP